MCDWIGQYIPVCVHILALYIYIQEALNRVKVAVSRMRFYICMCMCIRQKRAILTCYDPHAREVTASVLDFQHPT